MNNWALVTGGAGFIGSHVTRHCLASGLDVVALDDLSGGRLANVPPGAVFVQGSITDGALLERLFAEYRFSRVYHLAAYAAEGLSHYIRVYNYTNNVVGSAQLINLSVVHETAHFVFASSIAVYGSQTPPMVERMTPRPIDPYGIAKYAVELDLACAQQLYGLRYTIFRPHNVYGEHQNIADPYRNVIGIFMRQCLSGEPMTIFGDGHQTRAFSHVDDVAPYIAAAPTVRAAANQVYNIGSDHPYTVKHIAELVAREFRTTGEVVYLPERHEAVHAYANHEKFVADFGPGPTVPLEDGLARMAHWVRARWPFASTAAPPIEVSKGLPSAWAVR
jgi:UDP-glucose 4-epimerase